jgi:hypothetical protein
MTQQMRESMIEQEEDLDNEESQEVVRSYKATDLDDLAYMGT